ncbi:Type III restriction enzyme, res subunit [Actinobaculum suis]|uniref:DEAD/DEAH box helicase n=1 Tax=Actinobaculum suis TaxID=1657 RepID=A0A1G7ABM5_9ACTO|nr:DEAD/DEAH box helicase [Actinobaculum suis]MDY5152618.1 DEAD/DEAH box helicase [Actinobaculum suis]SDE12160.1 Type III restriction enzyme, res subunit [Actinobaculum suis]
MMQVPASADAVPDSVDTVPEAQFSPGSLIIARSERWIVQRVQRARGGAWRLEARGVSDYVRDQEVVFFTDLEQVTPIDPHDVNIRADNSPHFRRTRLAVESALRQIPVPLDERSFTVADRMLADPLDYQLAAVEKILDSDSIRPRILLADAVGLGKTIEIGMILGELIARGRGERIIVVTPKHMMEQTQQELWARFAIPLVRLDSAGIQRVRQKLPASRNPFTYYPRVIVSIDTLKSPRYRAQLGKVRWDAAVIDEIHNASNPGTQNNQLARLIASRTDALILASATPHNGDPRSFTEILSMLDSMVVLPNGSIQVEEASKLIVRRHRNSPEVAREVGSRWAPRSEPRNILVPASPEENAVLRELSERWLPASRATSTADVAAPAEASPTAGTATSTAGAAAPAESSPTAGTATSTADDAAAPASRTGSRSSGISGVEKLFPWTLFKAALSSPAALIETVDNRRKAAQDPEERQALADLRAVAEQVTPDKSAKLQRLITYLEEIGVGRGKETRAVVFSERNATLRWIQENLEKQLKLGKGAVEIMHGGLSDEEQMRIIDDFKRADSPIRVLVTGDIASEGVNLHLRCHDLIHFDVPWSLIRIQQRNGRIDRYGQLESPRIAALLLDPADDSLAGELRVFERLIEREHEATRVLGDASLLMGKTSVEAEEKEIRQVLAGEVDLDEAVPDPEQAVAKACETVGTTTQDPDVFLLSLLRPEDRPQAPAPAPATPATPTPTAPTAAPQPATATAQPAAAQPATAASPAPAAGLAEPAASKSFARPVPRSLYRTEADYLVSALEEGFDQVSRKPLSEGGVGLEIHAQEGVISLTPPRDLARRLDFLPQDYVAERGVKTKLALATRPDRANASLREAREGISHTTWPAVHYLGPLHPVTQWAADRALASDASTKPTITAAVSPQISEPCVLLVATISNRLGQVVARSFVAAQHYGGTMFPQTIANPYSWLREHEISEEAVNPGELAPEDLAGAKELIIQAVRSAETLANNTLEANQKNAQKRLDSWRARADAWQVQRAGHSTQRVIRTAKEIQRERELADSLQPDRLTVRPLLLLYPEVHLG